MWNLREYILNRKFPSGASISANQAAGGAGFHALLELTIGADLSGIYLTNVVDARAVTGVMWARRNTGLGGLATITPAEATFGAVPSVASVVKTGVTDALDPVADNWGLLSWGQNLNEPIFIASGFVVVMSRSPNTAAHLGMTWVEIP